VKAPRTVLAVDKVRYVGHPLAFVVAESQTEARDAAEAVMPDIEGLPAAVTPAEAAAPGAPLLYEEAPGNLMVDYHHGDTDAVTRAFASAAHVTTLDIVSQRLVVNPLEPRAAIGEYEPESERFTLHLGTQGVFGMRASLAEPVLKVPVEKLRILTRQVGGSFGMKASPFPEYVCLLHAARELGRPVKWTDGRSESFMSDHHGRGLEVTAELALDRDGRFLAVRIAGLADMGAECTPVAPLFSTINIGKNAVGTYRTPLMQTDIKCFYTNATPISAYRGAGRPEGNYIMERLIETAAHEMGLDANALRRLNHIQPDQLPYETPGESTYDSGEFTALLDRTLSKADWDGFAARKAESLSRGKLRSRRHGHHRDRHARLRPGPLDALRPGTLVAARRAVRGDPPRPR
jgi:carbon-monoxide dehydrogenase large subunit